MNKDITMVARAFVNFGDYNGYKDVKFVMRPEDVPFRQSLAVEAITVIAMVDVKKKAFTHEGTTYDVYEDWSVGPKKS
jgi:hypothetical protein